MQSQPHRLFETCEPNADAGRPENQSDRRRYGRDCFSIALRNLFRIGTEGSIERDVRVLIADDQRDVGTSLAELVRECNHQIVGVVGSGFEAIQAYNQLRPDLVLMDYWMPKLNGATACRNILAKDPTAHVIFVSGWLPSNDANRSGATAILSKPVDLHQLELTLIAVAGLVRAHEPASNSITIKLESRDSPA